MKGSCLLAFSGDKITRKSRKKVYNNSLFILPGISFFLFHRATQQIIQNADHSKCKSQDNLFYLKTHKTGSTTLAEILYRYGDNRNLTFVLPKGHDNDFRWPERFHLSLTTPVHGEERKFLVSHTVYNEAPVHLLFPKSNSKYITILRHPINHFESVWGFYELTEILKLKNDIDPIQSFLRNPNTFVGLLSQHRQPADLDKLIRNPLMHDLGLDPRYFLNRNVVKQYIKYIEEEFDLVLINEYYDESLILLKNLLCWDLEDILYMKQRVRKTRASLNNEKKANILSWSRADFLLYKHFNSTLWRKIAEAGPKFDKDLQIFREKRKIVQESCLQELEKGKVEIYREEHYPNKHLQMCAQMAREIPRYLEYMKKRMEKKWEAVDQTSFEGNYNSPENIGDENRDFKYKAVLIPSDSP